MLDARAVRLPRMKTRSKKAARTEHVLELRPAANVPPESAIPSATYRLQFSRNFRFEDAIRILDYLRDLGITHVYASPILGSRRGSEHGYDATDPTRIDPDLGSEEDLYTLQRELHDRGMGLVLDLVPNHMAASSENPWWMDVLENGRGSAFASYFDIDWHPGPRSLEGKVLLPVLGRPFGEALDSGELGMLLDQGKFLIQYYESTFPLAPKSYRQVLIHRIEKLKEFLAEEAADYQEYVGILASLASLFRTETATLESPADKRLKFESIRGRLRQLVETSREIDHFVQSNIEEFNGKQADPASFCLLEALLADQHYKLAYWQNVNESINYRRFFTITDLVGMRVEDPAVFEATHSLALRIATRQGSTGLRIDHVDGLRDPEGYLQKLQEKLCESRVPGGDATSPYLVVEKILSQNEELPESWPIQGTTGYDYLNHANGIFVFRDNAPLLEAIYGRFIGKELTFDEVVVEKKRLVMNTLLGVEMRALGRQLAEIAGDDRYARELSRAELTSALIETTAQLPVYRTYVRNLTVPDESKLLLENAIASARTARPHLNAACFDFLREVLLLLPLPHVLPRQREARLAFVMRWQQFTGPIVAKGVEDTALYVYQPLISLNEVGGNAQPSQASSRSEFVDFLAQRQARWPHSLNATTTHDTKRSEDVRARINVLSEIPEQWEGRLKRWSELNAVHKREVDGQMVPDGNEEYLLYQTLLGIYPADGKPSDSLRERVQEYVVKATREAMIHTRWTRPNLAHEQALAGFVDSIFSPGKSGEFLADFLAFHAHIAFFGMVNSLSQALLKITCPGVPDFYQGSELWDLRLVDPDNRRAVDFEYAKSCLTALDHDPRDLALQSEALLARWTDGSVKMWLINRALHFRRERLPLFADGAFVPLNLTGSRSDCAVSFLRRHGRDWAIVVAPRWLAQAQAPADRIPPPEFWNDTTLHLRFPCPVSWRNVLTDQRVAASQSQDGASIKLADALHGFSVALLSAEYSADGGGV